MARKKRLQPALSFAGIQEAERTLLDLANYIYGHTPIKPMSKVLFLVSRCLLLAQRNLLTTDPVELSRRYYKVCECLKGARPDDDFNFAAVIDECDGHLDYLTNAISHVRRSTESSDALGLAFNTLLRGKYEGGEGLGTFLTPEEVVFPMVDMTLTVVDESLLENLGRKTGPFYGDVCGGTGRFVYALTRRLVERGFEPQRLSKAARLFDQSSFAVDCARLNFLFDGLTPEFQRVGDSLVEGAVSQLRGRFAILATNPPFGTGKYRWHPELRQSIPESVLHALGMTQIGDTADPAELFFFRNLDLLTQGGALAIVLPDGVLHASRFLAALRAYEQETGKLVDVAAIVSLPVVTFALGGTVAKTSFVVVRSGEPSRRGGLFLGRADHVGFKKRGNRRVPDPDGNDLVRIAAEFRAGTDSPDRGVSSWREYQRLAPSDLSRSGSKRDDGERKLRDVVQAVKVSTDEADFHVSVLDVDETGLIDIVHASTNEPTSPGLCCKPGDIILSCINPRIWRLAVIPTIDGRWSCSPEFVVLRPKRAAESWAIAAALHHVDAMQAIQAMAGGTSSSRQRVPKHLVLDIQLPNITVSAESLKQHATKRTEFYLVRLREYEAYQALHDGNRGFSF